LFPFRKLPAKKLLIIGGLFIAFEAGWSAVGACRQVERRSLAAAGDAAEKAGGQPTEQQAEAKQELEAQRKQRQPSSAALEKDARRWRGNPLQVIGARARFLAVWHDLAYYARTYRAEYAMTPLAQVLR
jgi:hypothetical protein